MRRRALNEGNVGPAHLMGTIPAELFAEKNQFGVTGLIEIIGVRFKRTGKIYYFDPAGLKFQKGDRVVVETARGVELCEVWLENRTVEEAELSSRCARFCARRRRRILPQPNGT